MKVPDFIRVAPVGTQTASISNYMTEAVERAVGLFRSWCFGVGFVGVGSTILFFDGDVLPGHYLCRGLHFSGFCY